MIGFIGSVFSPWYAWSGRAEPQNHCCINVATYGPGGRFTMTDRGRDALRQSGDEIKIGPSSMRWTGSELIIDIDERAALPQFGAVRGRITLSPAAVTDVELPLAPDDSHIWRPYAPVARIKVDLEAAGWQWDGHGYFDANFGARALEADFDYWTWARFPSAEGAACFYDAERRDGSTLSAAVGFDAAGNARMLDAPPPQPMKRSAWMLRREARADPGHTARQVQPMLDAPFYARAGVETVINGETMRGVHEALDLRRFASPLLKPMLAVRVPRRARWPR